ncbi:hypothetical protein C8N24_2870 [Solirubrobacter pauli]|uniref:Uncharacterized protein n=1 Tax=Solirubrobacter pauli TaxID=166793 RepID=A0A660LJ39_9ACTN|nr:hypothetical protein [Solirubrobacter pauli]RKQ93011.1 hypothetical protein C8N24_2870 [Solirubrobacter pauli]
MLKASLALAAMASLVGAGTAQAAAAPTNSLTASFATPSNAALIQTNTVPVRISVGPGVTRVQVFNGTQDISKRFTKRGNAFVANLPRSLFKPGQNTLLMQARGRGGKGGAASRIAFIIPKGKASRLRVRTGAGASVSVRSKTPTYARLSVNGRTVSDLRANRPLDARQWVVSARDGLKVGPNQFVAETWDSKGNYAVKRWTFNRSAARPLADAGPGEQAIVPKQWMTLDASSSKATQKGAKLGYAWRIVKQPAGSKPVLRNANAVKPQFKADKPGVYKLALRATQAKPGQASAAAANTAGQDTITLDAAPTVGASGLYVGTDLEGYPGQQGPPENKLYIEGQPYAGDTNFTDSTTDTFVQLDETTLAPIANGTDQNITPTPGTITIGAWFNHGVRYSSDNFGSAIWIGNQQVAYNASPNAPSGSLTIGNPFTNLHGWIKPASSDSADDATWVGSDMLQVKTREGTDTPTTNTMQVGANTFPVTLPDGMTGGYQLVVLDNDGNVQSSQVYGVNASDQTSLDDQGPGHLAYDMEHAAQNTTFLLQGFGQLPPIPVTSYIAQTLQNFGGRADVVSRFNGKADPTGGVYSLITAQSPTANNKWSAWAAAEASFERTGTTGTQTALLVRDANANDYIPFNADSATPDPNGQNRYGLMPLIYGAPSSWANWVRNPDGTLRAGTAGENAALAAIAAEATAQGWVPTVPTCPDAPDVIRGDYCNTNTTSVQNLKDDVNAITPAAGPGYTAADMTTAKTTLFAELTDVLNVRSSIIQFQNLFGTTKVNGIVDAATIGDAINKALGGTADDATPSNLPAYLSAMTDMASVLPEIGAPMTFLSGAFSLLGTTEPGWNPQPLMDNVTVTRDTAAATLNSALQQASTDLSYYGDLIDADPVKLQQGARFFLNHTPDTTNSQSTFVRGASYATAQWLWGTMLGTAYSAYSADPSIGTNPYCSANMGAAGHPFSNLTGGGQWPSSGTDGTTTPANWLLGMDNGSGEGWATRDGMTDNLKQIGMPPTLTNPVFGLPVSTTTDPSATTNAGAMMPYFALDYLRIKSLPLAPQNQWHASPAPRGCQPY